MQVEKKLMKLCPKSVRIPVKYHYQKVRKRLEKEILYLDKLLMDGKRAIDIGANEGLYSYALSKICEVVEAFEPQSWCTEAIIDYSEAHGRNINVYNVGLSNFNGSLNLYIPSKDDSDSGLVTGLASFRKMDENEHCVEVPVRKLDDYNFQDVSFIKIDVEGHENKVIEGGCNTIAREKPILLIEIEQRHLTNQTIDMIFEQILSFGYQGSFLYKNSLVALSNFSYKENQELFLDNVYNEEYIRNFIFQPVSTGTI